jgi:hypothetical protein
MDRFTSLDGLKKFFVRQFQSLRPSIFSKHPHFNFITAHCESLHHSAS